jgi:surface antigen
MKAAILSRISMHPLFRILSVAALLALAGCGTNDSSNYSQGPMLGTMTPPADDTTDSTDTTVANTPPPSQTVQAGVQSLDIASFVDPTAFGALGDTAKTEASSAQYFALQYGRVGAARTWSGENNVTGQINVGPYVKVNNRDCRDFTNVVNVGSKSYTKRGTACREDDGTWTVGSAAAAAPAAIAPAASGVGAAG